jgi:hypothetical protein
MCHIVAGMNNSVWMATAGAYGVTDIAGPDFTTVSVSSFMLGEPKVVTLEVTDATGVDSTGVMFNWKKDAEGYDWEYTALYDSSEINELGIGTYYFHLPDSALFFAADTTMQVLVAGDNVEFYSDGYDLNAIYGAEHGGLWTNLWVVDQSIASVKESDAAAPLRFELGVNYPNPFNSSTMIPFTLSRTAEVKVAVYDLSGREVATLFSGKAAAGRHEVSWTGEGFTSGIYFYAIEAAGERQVAKMALIR